MQHFAYACMVYVLFNMARSFSILFCRLKFLSSNLFPVLKIGNSRENFSPDLGLKPGSPCVHATDEKKKVQMLHKQMDNSHVTSCSLSHVERGIALCKSILNCLLRTRNRNYIELSSTKFSLI